MLIVGSVAIAFVGRMFMKDTMSADVQEMLFQLFLITGGGVGGNFMAHGLLMRPRSEPTDDRAANEAGGSNE